MLTPSSPERSPLSLARMLSKSWLVVLLGWVVGCALTVLVVFEMPTLYRSETLILVDSQKIPERYVAATVSTDLQDRLATINQQILSSTRLKRIIEDFGLYAQERRSEVEEEIIERMRKDIDIRVEHGWSGNRPGAFRIAYRGRVPAVVAEVANRLAGLYIEENLKTREVQAEGTAEFLENQLREAQRKLDGLEQAVGRYKTQHNGELPQQEAALSGALARLQIELQGQQDALARAQQARIVVENALTLARSAAEALAHPSAAKAAPSSEARPPAPDREREVLEAQLTALRLRYQENHPDVRAVRERLEAWAPAQPHTASPGPGPAPPDRPPANPEFRQRVVLLESQLAAVEKELEGRAAERQRILRDMRSLQAHLDRLPLREQEMAALTRDYENSKANYRSLLDKKLAAEMATEMERRQKAERFTILDPARIPEKPFFPNRPLWLGLGAALGLGLAAAAGIGKEWRKDVLLGEWELPPGTTVLGRVPPMALTAVAAEGGERP